MVRIAFGEQNAPNEKVFFRSAVSVSVLDAIGLAHLLTDLVKPLESQLDQAVAAATAQKANAKT